MHANTRHKNHHYCCRLNKSESESLSVLNMVRAKVRVAGNRKSGIGVVVAEESLGLGWHMDDSEYGEVVLFVPAPGSFKSVLLCCFSSCSASRKLEGRAEKKIERWKVGRVLE
jgi:hypothetical protein